MGNDEHFRIHSEKEKRFRQRHQQVNNLKEETFLFFFRMPLIPILTAEELLTYSKIESEIYLQNFEDWLEDIDFCPMDYCHSTEHPFPKFEDVLQEARKVYWQQVNPLKEIFEDVNIIAEIEKFQPFTCSIPFTAERCRSLRGVEEEMITQLVRLHVTQIMDMFETNPNPSSIRKIHFNFSDTPSRLKNGFLFKTRVDGMFLDKLSEKLQFHYSGCLVESGLSTYKKFWLKIKMKSS